MRCKGRLCAEKIDLSQVALIVVGDGPMRQEIKNKLSKIAPNLHLLGIVSSRFVSKL